MKVVFCTYSDRKGEPENGYWKILQHLEGLKEKDLLVRIDINKKTEYSLDEEDFFFPALKISHLKLKKLDDRKFEATFDTKNLRNVFTLLVKLAKHGNGGHSYELLIGKNSFYIDGDGADHLVSINDVAVNKIKENDYYHWHEIWEKDLEKDTEDEKNVIKINEEQLQKIVLESVKRVLENI